MKKKSKKIFYSFGEIDKKNNRITEKLLIKGLKNTKKVTALIDTGAQRSLIDLSLASEIGARLTGEINRVGGLEGDSEKYELEIAVILNKQDKKYFQKEDHEIKIELTLWPGLNRRVGFPILLGMDFWLAAEQHNYKFTINLDH